MVGYNDEQEFSAVVALVSSNYNGMRTDSARGASPYLAPLVLLFLALLSDFGAGKSATIFQDLLLPRHHLKLCLINLTSCLLDQTQEVL